MKNKIFIFGFHPCKSALENPFRKKHELLISREKVEQYGDLIKKNEKIVKIKIIDKDYFKKFAPQNLPHQGIALYAETLENISIKEFLHSTSNKKHVLITIIDHIQDPHNVGAIIRSSVAFNADAIITSKNNSPKENSIIAKSASGGLDLIPIITVTNIASTIDILKCNGFWSYGLDCNANDKIHLTKFHERSALIIGSEHEGMRKLIKEKCDFILNILISKKIDSLNASNAAAITMYAYSINHESCT